MLLILDILVVIVRKRAIIRAVCSERSLVPTGVSPERAAVLSMDWVAFVIARNLAIYFIFYGGAHHFLYESDLAKDLAAQVRFRGNFGRFSVALRAFPHALLTMLQPRAGLQMEPEVSGRARQARRDPRRVGALRHDAEAHPHASRR